MEADELDFSFSGLKTAVLRHVEERFGVTSRSDVPGSFHPVLPENPSREVRDDIRTIASAFQEAVTEVLVVKGLRAARRYGSKTLIVCGGVAANLALRVDHGGSRFHHGAGLIIPYYPSAAIQPAGDGKNIGPGTFICKCLKTDGLDPRIPHAHRSRNGSRSDQ